MDVNKLLWPAQKDCTSSVYCLSVFRVFDVDKLVSCSSGKVESFFQLLIEGQTLGEPRKKQKEFEYSYKPNPGHPKSVNIWKPSSMNVYGVK